MTSGAEREVADADQALSPLVISAISANFVIFVLSRLFQLGFVAVMARLLVPAQFGVAASATLFISFVQFSAQFGVGIALIQSQTVDDYTLRVANTFSITAAGAFTLISIAIAPLAGAWFHNPAVVDPTRALALAVLAQGIMLAPQSVLSRQLRTRDLGLIELFSNIVGSAGVAIPLAFWGMSYWSLVIGTVVQAVTKAIVLLVVTRIDLRPAVDFKLIRRLCARGGGYYMLLCLNRLSAEIDRLVVGRYLGPADLGFYGRAAAVAAFPGSIYSAVVDRVTLPAFARVQGERVRLLAAYRSGLSLIAVFGLPMTVGLIMLGPNLIRLLLGPGWEPSTAVFDLLSLSMYFRLSLLVSGTVLRGMGRPYLLSLIQLGVALLTGLAALMLWPYGIQAVAGAVAFVSLLEYLVTTRIGCQQTGLGAGEFTRTQVHGLAGAGLAAVTLWPVLALSARLHLGALATLSFAGAALGLVGGAALILAPALILGEAGQTALRLLLTAMKRRFSVRSSANG